MSTITTEPCPFCGSDEIRFRENDFWTGMRSTTLSWELHHSCTDTFKDIKIQVRAKTKEETIELWNKRNENSTIS